MKFPPVALIVEDEDPVRKLMRMEYLDNTDIGVLMAADLREAAEFLEDHSISFDALVVDLYFQGAAKAENLELYDGLDLVEYSKKFRPGMPVYVVSALPEEEWSRKKARDLDLPVMDWIPKIGTEEAPWQRVERGLASGFERASLSESEPELGVERSSAFGFRPRHRFTYLQIDESGLSARPIEVICRQEAGEWVADAFKLGLFQEGRGQTIRDAIDDLQGLIIDEWNYYKSLANGVLSDYDMLVWERLKNHLSEEAG